MLKLVVLFLISFSALAAGINTTPDATGLAESLRSQVTEEDLGEVKSTECVEAGAQLQCTFIYDLPIDYCWYGEFKAEAVYTLPSLNLVTYKVNWQN